MQFLPFPQCFLSIWRTFCHFFQIWNCRLQTLAAWRSPKFVVWERVKVPSWISLHGFHRLILNDNLRKFTPFHVLQAIYFRVIYSIIPINTELPTDATSLWLKNWQPQWSFKGLRNVASVLLEGCSNELIMHKNLSMITLPQRGPDTVAASLQISCQWFVSIRFRKIVLRKKAIESFHVNMASPFSVQSKAERWIEVRLAVRDRL